MVRPTGRPTQWAVRWGRRLPASHSLDDILVSLQAAVGAAYHIERELGGGGMSRVFLADETALQRRVVIKILRPELAAGVSVERFRREIQLAASLQHPHIVPLFSAGSSGDWVYYTMPYVEGESLRDRLTREIQLPVDDALRITAEVAAALAHAHSRGIVHRDIKPENILLSGGTAVVTDFGIARAVTAAGTGEHLTQTGTIIGTPAYMSPEQAAGSTEIDGRSDEYSLACVAYEMLVGEPPFTGPNPQAVMARHSLDSVSPPSIVRATTPHASEGAILRALSKVPADRFPTVVQFAEALTTPSPASGTYRRTPVPAPARSRVRRALLVALPLAVAALAWFAWRRAMPGDGGRAEPRAGLDPRHIAVLYLTPDATSPHGGAVADGLTEALIAQLTQVRTLSVISPNGVARYRGTDAAPDSIARALGVGSVIAGSLVDAGGHLRVTVRLVDGASGVDVARQSFERPSGDPLAVRDELVRQVVQFLRERLGTELRVQEQRAGTKNVEAWLLVQQAERARKDAEQLRGAAELDSALTAFQRADTLLAQAEAADPTWVEPTVLRARVAYREAVRAGGDKRAVRHWVGVALAHLGRAFARAPHDPAALELRGTVRFLSWFNLRPTDPAEATALLQSARDDLEAAVAADPTRASAYVMLSHLYYQTEDVLGALLAARKAYEADAYLAVANDVVARLFYGSYDLDQIGQAKRWCDEGTRRFPTDFRFAECQLLLMMTDAADPEVGRAWSLVVRLDSLVPASRRPYEHAFGAVITGGVIGRAGRRDSADRVLVRARVGHEIDPTQELVGYEAAMRALVGDRDTAIALLKRYVAANPGHSFTRGGDIMWWWRDLQKDPRFAQVTSLKGSLQSP